MLGLNSGFAQAEKGSLFVPVKHTYFKQPVTPFLKNSKEKTESLTFYHCDVKEVQEGIDNLRAKNEETIIIVHLRGHIFVEEEALTIGSNVCLSFEGCGQMQAVSSSGCEALIHVENAEYASITAVEDSALAVLDGKNFAKSGIKVSNSGKVNIDNINIVNCENYGISFSGRGAALLNDASSITRCEIRGGELAGINVNEATRFVLMDNIVNEAKCGICVRSKSATVVGNTCTNNTTGLLVGEASSISGPGAVIARNILQNNNVGLSLSSSSNTTIVTENTISKNSTGLLANGSRNHIYNNYLSDNNFHIDDRGSENVIAQHDSVSSEDISLGTNTSFFDPPTIGNPHSRPVIVSGMGRRDLSFTQEEGADDIDLATVQTALDAERSNYPNDIIVLWLTGNFVAQGEYTGLDLPKNTCVILDGTIYPMGDGMDRNSAPDHYLKERHSGGTQLVLMKNTGYNSFSGGVLDCKQLCAYGIYAPGDNVGIIDSVNVKDAVDNNVGTIYHSGNATPLFIRGCKFQGSEQTNRAVWVHVCSYVHCISNYSENHYADYVDIDAGGHYSTVLFSTCFNERRTGIFIEEKASNNFCVGNTTLGPLGNGISLYSAIGGTCDNNIIVGNTFTGPYGMNIRHAQNTFAFNNICNTGRFGVYINVTNNYSAQNSLVSDSYLLNDIITNPYYNAPYFVYESENGCSDKVYFAVPETNIKVTESKSDITFNVELNEVNEGNDIILGIEDQAIGSATSGDDYETIPTDAQILIPSGSKNGSYTLHILNDDIPEYEETVYVNITVPEETPIALKQVAICGMIQDDESYVASLTAKDSVDENTDSELLFTVYLNRKNESGAALQIPINDTHEGSASAGKDYEIISENTSIDIPIGDSIAIFSRALVNDMNLELKEEVKFNITTTGNILALDSVASMFILDDDFGAAKFSASETMENDSIGLIFTISLTGANETGEDIIFSDFSDLETGTADAAIDYNELISWEAEIIVPVDSSSGSYILPIIDDEILEGQETINVQLLKCSSNRIALANTEATAIILDDEYSEGVFSPAENELKCYPNPAYDKIYIQSKNNFYTSTLRINSIFGQSVYQQEIETNEIDISGLNPGVYLLEIADDETLRTTKFIKL